MADFDWRGWSDWHCLGIEQGFNFVNAPNKPGAYVIATDRQLNRAVGADSDGILTIGESDDLHRRVTGFASCALTYGTKGHMAGWRFAFFRFAKHFPFASLRIRWNVTPTKEEAYDLEGRMLLAYLSRHLELPPLNYQFNWSPFEKDGWDLFDILMGLKTPPADSPFPEDRPT